MSGLPAALSREHPLLLDGGMGSLLIAAGLPGGTAPEAWVLERPEDVAAAHARYAGAGCDAVLTCTFGGHPLRLARFGLAERCEAIAAEAVRLARAAGTAFVIGDLGPTGEGPTSVRSKRPRVASRCHHPSRSQPKWRRRCES